jgi:uncharacterized short protein YbdD (DUF466 family)
MKFLRKGHRGQRVWTETQNMRYCTDRRIGGLNVLSKLNPFLAEALYGPKPVK